jgi:putative hydroxymethylpyrimidine transport system substrate-binding protein
MKKTILFFISFIFYSSLLAQPLQHLTLILDWFVNPTHMPIIIAQEKGFFRQHGLDVSIVAPADPGDPSKLVATGNADIAIAYQPELYLQVQGGLPIVRVGTLINKPLRVVAVLETSPIKTLADLKGKTIAYSTAGIDTAILGTMLNYNGVSLNQINAINVHYDLVQALLAKKVDAVTGVDRNFEIPELQLAGQPARVFYPENNGVPPFDEMIFVANKKSLNDPRLLAFMEAVQEGAAYIKAHPQQSWALLIEPHPELNNEINKLSYQVSLPYFAEDSIKLDKTRYESFATWMQEQKLIQEALPLSDYAVQLH